jgi:hypothetical protein
VVVEDASGVRAVPGGFQYLLPPLAETTAARGLTGTTRGAATTVINLDGQPGLDVIMARIDPTLSFFFQGDGRGRFTEVRPDWGAFMPQTASLVIADFTGDGRLDLATGPFVGASDPALLLLEGRGDGFAVPPGGRARDRAWRAATPCTRSTSTSTETPTSWASSRWPACRAKGASRSFATSVVTWWPIPTPSPTPSTSRRAAW